MWFCLLPRASNVTREHAQASQGEGSQTPEHSQVIPTTSAEARLDQPTPRWSRSPLERTRAARGTTNGLQVHRKTAFPGEGHQGFVTGRFEALL